MAILHRASITPTKLEIVELWLDRQPWGGSGPIEQVGSFRFDDPDGQVGVESLLVRRGDRVLQVPMTYRGEPLAGAEQHLITTMEHTALGTRWVYEASGDPVAIGCFTRALAGEQEQATLQRYDGDTLIEHLEPDTRIHRESGKASDAGALKLAQVLGDPLDGADQLRAIWRDGEAIVAVR